MVIPVAMRDYPQFILYNSAKLPLHPFTLEVCDPHDTTNWVTAPEIDTLSALTGYGIGFVFSQYDPFFFLDIDKCWSVDEWSPMAQQLLHAFHGCAVEVSVSGNGLHIFGVAGPQEHACKNVPLGIELYTEGRFCALTGNSASGDAACNPGANYPWLVGNYFTPSAAGPDAQWTTEPVPEYTGPEDDQKLIERMLRSRSAANVFGGKVAIVDLWNENIHVLAEAFPPVDPTKKPYDHSSADAALLNHLAFWTGKNCERMQRLFEQSKLVRDKWHNRENYRVPSIQNSVAHCRNVYNRGKRPDTPLPGPGVPDTGPTGDSALSDGYQFMTVQDQIERFNGCIYVRDQHGILVPDGGILKPDQFRVEYGGKSYALDTYNEKTTKNAWEAFTESQGYQFPKVSSTCFRPECPPGTIINEENSRLVNTYVPINTLSLPGDPAPFLTHVAVLLPDLRDQVILLSYMAACVQYPGFKFQWAPLIQGTEGNGKSVLVRCMTHAIGNKYSHLPNASDLANKFNGWIQDKLFIGIEEIYTGDKQELIESLKPLITNDRIEIHRKGVDQCTGDNRANFMMFSNHKDGIRKTRNDRRYCVLYTAQQEHVDNIKAGLTDRYFRLFYEWLRAEGYAIVNSFLRSYQISEEFNPAGDCQRAPVTTSTQEAVSLSLGGVEQEIMAAVNEGRTGFSGGWISSMALDKLLHEKRADRRIPRNKRTQIMKDLGYVLHPGLRGGRVDNPTMVDGGKPRLYVREGHIILNETRRYEIVRAYNDAQIGTTGGRGTDDIPIVGQVVK